MWRQNARGYMRAQIYYPCQQPADTNGRWAVAGREVLGAAKLQATASQLAGDEHVGWWGRKSGCEITL